MKGIVNSDRIVSIGYVVRDIEASSRRLASILGVEVPEPVSSGDASVTNVEYRGNLAPDAACRMAFFRMGSVKLELIEPGEAPSLWREFLERRGEGVIEIAFMEDDSDAVVAEAERRGMGLLQKGIFRGGNGRYAYIDTLDEIGFYVEVLEMFKENINEQDQR